MEGTYEGYGGLFFNSRVKYEKTGLNKRTGLTGGYV